MCQTNQQYYALNMVDPTSFNTPTEEPDLVKAKNDDSTVEITLTETGKTSAVASEPIRDGSADSDSFVEMAENCVCKVKLPKVDTIQCLVCTKHFVNEEQRFEHFIDEHFENSRNILKIRCSLIRWLGNFSQHLSSTLIGSEPDARVQSESASFNAEHTTNSTRVGSVSPNIADAYVCQYCGSAFPNEESLLSHTIKHCFLLVPRLSSELQCSICARYLCSETATFLHLFDCHFVNAERRTEEQRYEILRWFARFFRTEKGVRLRFKYEQLSVEFTPLLEKILLNEESKLTQCRYCGDRKASLLELKTHYTERHTSSHSCPSPAMVCVLCNFSATSDCSLVSHHFRKHISCYCGHVSPDFESFCGHVFECTPTDNGILCPVCQNKRFICEPSFQDHIATGGRFSCAVKLKKNKWTCLLCGVKSSPEEIYEHVFLNHVKCHCNFRSKDFETFCSHLNKCSLMRAGVLCPVCRRVKCKSNECLTKHLVECLPWKEDAFTESTGNLVKFSDIQRFLDPNDVLRLQGLKRISDPDQPKAKRRLVIGKDY